MEEDKMDVLEVGRKNRSSRRRKRKGILGKEASMRAEQCLSVAHAVGNVHFSSAFLS